MSSSVTQNNPQLWLHEFPFPKRDGHKYDRGHALICGGEVMTGAARLAARAAQRMGAGLVTLASPEKVLAIYATALESIIVRPADSITEWSELANDPKRNALLVGPGLGVGERQRAFILVAVETHKACVLDADVFTNFSDRPDDLLSKLHDKCVLTPHEGEFARLFGTRIDAKASKVARAQEAANLAHSVVLLKGASTVIASPDGRTAVNTNAPAWLATAGAGDVLAGMILGLMAQGMPGYEAAAGAAWLHGKIATGFGPGLIAEDLVEEIPDVLWDLFSENKAI